MIHYRIIFVTTIIILLPSCTREWDESQPNDQKYFHDRGYNYHNSHYPQQNIHSIKENIKYDNQNKVIKPKSLNDTLRNKIRFSEQYHKYNNRAFVENYANTYVNMLDMQNMDMAPKNGFINLIGKDYFDINDYNGLIPLGNINAIQTLRRNNIVAMTDNVSEKFTTYNKTILGHYQEQLDEDHFNPINIITEIEPSENLQYITKMIPPKNKREGFSMPKKKVMNYMLDNLYESMEEESTYSAPRTVQHNTHPDKSY